MADSDVAEDVEDKAREASRHPLVERIGTLGFSTKGVMYVIIAAITIRLGWPAGSSGGAEASSTGAISELSESAMGKVLLLAAVFGLASYGLLRLLHVFLNPDGSDGVKGLFQRVAYLCVFATYAGLTVFSIRELLGGGSSSSAPEERLTARALDLPGGRYIVAVVAAVVLGVGLSQFWQLRTRDFLDRIDGASPRQYKIASWLGFVGHAARGAVFLGVSVLFARAAWQADSSEAGGVDEAIRAVADSAFGTPLLIALGAGLAAYGLYCLTVGRWGSARSPG